MGGRGLLPPSHLNALTDECNLSVVSVMLQTGTWPPNTCSYVFGLPDTTRDCASAFTFVCWQYQLCQRNMVTRLCTLHGPNCCMLHSLGCSAGDPFARGSRACCWTKGSFPDAKPLAPHVVPLWTPRRGHLYKDKQATWVWVGRMDRLSCLHRPTTHQIRVWQLHFRLFKGSTHTEFPCRFGVAPALSICMVLVWLPVPQPYSCLWSVKPWWVKHDATQAPPPPLLGKLSQELQSSG